MCPPVHVCPPVAAYIQYCILKMWPPLWLLAPLLKILATGLCQRVLHTPARLSLTKHSPGTTNHQNSHQEQLITKTLTKNNHQNSHQEQPPKLSPGTTNHQNSHQEQLTTKTLTRNNQPPKLSPGTTNHQNTHQEQLTTNTLTRNN